jgi:hypothetical protein
LVLARTGAGEVSASTGGGVAVEALLGDLVDVNSTCDLRKLGPGLFGSAAETLEIKRLRRKRAPQTTTGAGTENGKIAGRRKHGIPFV